MVERLFQLSCGKKKKKEEEADHKEQEINRPRRLRKILQQLAVLEGEKTQQYQENQDKVIVENIAAILETAGQKGLPSLMKNPLHLVHLFLRQSQVYLIEAGIFLAKGLAQLVQVAICQHLSLVEDDKTITHPLRRI